VVDLGEINGKRGRHSFKTKEEANTFAEQARIKKQNEGLAAFSLPLDIKTDAFRVSEILKNTGQTLHEVAIQFKNAHDLVKPFGHATSHAAQEHVYAEKLLRDRGLNLKGVLTEYAKLFDLLKAKGSSIVEAVEHYDNHVLRYRNAPLVDKIVDQMLDTAESNNRRERTVSDLRDRLKTFAQDFGDRRLTDIHVDELKDWIDEDGWAPRTRINYLTKISQLYNFAIRNAWAEANLAERIDRPDVDDNEPKIFTVEEAKRLLEHSIEFGLRPYIAIGLFAGLRSAELLRLKREAIKLHEKAIVVGADVAKKRSRRVVEMCDALVDALKSVLPIEGAIVDSSRFRDKMDALKNAAGITKWPHNALRHSFGSYHLAFHGDQVKTAAQMGHRDANVVHTHYKALVLRSEAEKYWSINI
jgi:integrase